MRDRYVKPAENEILFFDAYNLYGWAMCEPLPYIEIKFDSYVNLEVVLTAPDSDIGYFFEIVLKCPDENKGETKKILFRPQNKTSPQDKFNKHMKDIKPINYTENRKLLCDWTDKKLFNSIYDFEISC